MTAASRKYTRGNAILEYVLPLVVFFAATTLIMNISNTGDRLVEFFALSTNADGGNGGLVLRPFGSDVTEGFNGFQEGNEELCYSDGLCVEAPAWMNNDRLNHETAGTMGEKVVYANADILQQIADQMKEDGADPEAIAAVEYLANRGHSRGDYLANISSMVDNLCPPDAVFCSTRQSSYSEGFTQDGQQFFTTQRDGETVRVYKPRLQDYLSLASIEGSGNDLLNQMINLENSANPGENWENDWYKNTGINSQHHSLSNQILAGETPEFTTPGEQAAYQQYMKDMQNYYDERSNPDNAIENWQSDFKDLSGAQHVFHNLLKGNEPWLEQHYYNHKPNENIQSQIDFFMDDHAEFVNALSAVEQYSQNHPGALSATELELIQESAENIDSIWNTQVGDSTPVSVDIERTQWIEIQNNSNDICSHSNGGNCTKGG